ncbi:hypothetical protein ACJX0J_011961, partial [Zea mays]
VIGDDRLIECLQVFAALDLRAVLFTSILIVHLICINTIIVIYNFVKDMTNNQTRELIL